MKNPLHDDQRQKQLEGVGFTVLRFSDEEVLTAIDRVRGKLVEWIESNPDRSTQ